MITIARAVIASLAFVVLSRAAQFNGLHALVKRRAPAHSEDFSFTAITGEGDTFVVSDTPGKPGGITVGCTTTIACTRGLYTYLSEVTNVDIWLTGSRLSALPTRLPSVGPEGLAGNATVPFRYFFNTVTFGYTTAFYDFEKWELVLDWLALRGVNVPLSWVGYEYILNQVFLEAGLSQSEISTFFSDPAFLSWNRFGNIQGSFQGGNGLPIEWIQDQFELSKKIVNRIVELGMTPILPAFTGFVPRAFPTHFPNASIINGSQWDGFPTQYTNVTFLQPFDPLFATLQKSFLQKQLAAYGNVTHYYTLDQYNENTPSNGDLDYLSNIANSTLSSLRSVDPDAIWVMQGWLFFALSSFWTEDRIRAYLSESSPSNSSSQSRLILDLYSEAQPQWNRTSNYFGNPWIWCELHGLGGSMGMTADLEALINAPTQALQTAGSGMQGVGLTMEGMTGNEITFDLLLDWAWKSPGELNVGAYIDSWVKRRYHVKGVNETAKEALDAWKILSTTVFEDKDLGTLAAGKGILEVTPSLTGLLDVEGLISTKISYNTNTTLVPALKLLLQAPNSTHDLDKVPEFQYDIVDITRQILSNRFNDLYSSILKAYNSSSANEVSAIGSRMVDLLLDLDSLLNTNENFLLSTWISDAKQWSHSKSSNYTRYLEYSARNQLTLWGPDGEISDYASKQWSGLVKEYYAPRWKDWSDYLVKLKQTGGEYNATEFGTKMLEFGKIWDGQVWGERDGETWGISGNTFDVLEKILRKWVV
ncbi:alpha-N-acetylglucosaminidase [Abortiporus biennis]|nr:alpha-N-acetylglucosaminidase [Abortiporus biennis]